MVCSTRQTPFYPIGAVAYHDASGFAQADRASSCWLPSKAKTANRLLSYATTRPTQAGFLRHFHTLLPCGHGGDTAFSWWQIETSRCCFTVRCAGASLFCGQQSGPGSGKTPECGSPSLCGLWRQTNVVPTSVRFAACMDATGNTAKTIDLVGRTTGTPGGGSRRNLRSRASFSEYPPLLSGSNSIQLTDRYVSQTPSPSRNSNDAGVGSRVSGSSVDDLQVRAMKFSFGSVTDFSA